jgi:hypothetical protein
MTVSRVSVSGWHCRCHSHCPTGAADGSCYAHVCQPSTTSCDDGSECRTRGRSETRMGVSVSGGTGRAQRSSDGTEKAGRHGRT